MISVTSQTGKYILQPGLVTMHQESLNWISTATLWKRELNFFQKLLDQNAIRLSNVDFKKEVDHFQNLIIYYDGELVDQLKKKLRDHENKLAHMLQSLNETDVEYFKEHQAIISEVSSFNKVFAEFKHSFFEFIERGMTNN